MKLIFKYWQIVVLTLFCLTPLIWFLGRGDALINGLDTNFPLDPITWFYKRFFVWNSSFNNGADFSSSVSGMFFHFIQLVPFLLFKNLQYAEMFSLVFWFSLVVFSAHYFSGVFISRNKVVRLIFVLIYSFNIYLFNTWENAKVSNLALIIGLPLFLGLVHQYIQLNLSKERFLISAVIFSIIVSGAGINPAYFFTIIFALLIYTVCFSLFFIGSNQFKKVWLAFFSLSSILVLVNLFWIFPLTNFLFFNKRVVNLSDIGFTNWLDSLSENTSILNILRLQGAWDWYAFDASGFPLYIPYALNYLYNPLFIIFSFTLPVLAITSLIFRYESKRKIYIFFATLMLLGIFLGVGSHEPTGVLYKYFVNKIPMFSLFRSPWYIFTPLLLIAYAGLISLLIDFLFKKEFNKIFIYSGCLVFAICYLLYSYPLVTGKIFRPNNDGFYVNFPEYVFDSKKWLDANESNSRLIIYPDDQLERFSWGYKGTESIIGLLSNVEFVGASFNVQDKIFNNLIEQLYVHLKKGEYDSAFSIMSSVGVNTIFNKNDSAGSLAPKINDIAISNGFNVDINKFGEWSFITLNSDVNQKVYSPKLIYVNSSEENTYPFIAGLLTNQAIVINNKNDKVLDKHIQNTSISFMEAKNTSNKDAQTDPNQKYLLNVSKSGDYYLAIDKKGLAHASDIKISSNPQIDFSSSLLKQTDAFFIYGPITLPINNYTLDVKYPEHKPTILTDSYTDIIDFSDLRGGELPVNLKNTIVLFNSNTYAKKVIFPVINFDPYLNYLFEFDYRYFYGSVPFVSYLQLTDTANLKSSSESVGSSFDWDKRIISIKPVPVASRMQLMFELPANYYGNKSKMYLENLKLSKIYDNRIFLIEEDKKNTLTNYPNVEYKKISPVEYEVNVKNIKDNYFIVFLESYSSDWVMKTNNNNGTPYHFKANGYANGWLVPDVGEDQKLVIYYRPQKYYYIGLSVSVLTIMATIIFVIYRKIKQYSK